MLTTGTLYLEMTDGKSATSNFAARGLVDDAESQTPKFKEWQGWCDYIPYFQAGMLDVPRVYEENKK